MIPYSLIRRYTPPTCTLEIWAKSSPLSFWTETIIVKDLNFELRFDDPKLPEEQQVTINGDRDQLEVLAEVVSDYVQKFLLCSISLSSDTQIKQDHLLTPFLQSQGMLTHELFFGSLAPQIKEAKITLSVSQLYDLANALEEYSAELSVLPDLNKIKSPQSNLAKLAKASAVALAIGLGSASVIFFQRTHQQTASIASPADSGVSKPDLAKISPLSVPKPAPKTPIPQPTLPSELSSEPKRTPPDPVSPPQPSSWVPNKNFSSSTNNKQQDQKTESNLSPLSEDSKAINKKQKPQLDKLPPLKTNQTSETSPRLLEQSKAVNSPTAEVKNYFQQRWQPPKDLTQALEYRLLINNDGSVKQIIPLKQISTIYLKRTPMPAQGEKLISPPARDLTVRLVLNTDGSVGTFLESN